MSVRTLTLAALLAGVFMLPAIAMAEDAPPAAAAAEEEKAPETRTPMMHKHFEEADTDKNGILSLEEFLERHKKKFEEIDADKSGGLTPDEMKAYGEAHREEWKERREKMDGMREKMGETAPEGLPPVEKPAQ